MTQQINTNSVGGNNNHNPNVVRGKGRDQWDFGSCWGCGSWGGCRNNISIAKSLFEEKLKDGCLYKLTITENSHQATQLKKICNALSSLCANKSFKHLDNMICNNQEMAKANLMLPYLATDQ